MHPILGWEQEPKTTHETIEDWPGEKWKPIPGYEQYELSQYKRVRNTKTNKEIQLHYLKGKYPVITAYCNGKQKQIRINPTYIKLFIENE